MGLKKSELYCSILDFNDDIKLGKGKEVTGMALPLNLYSS